MVHYNAWLTVDTFLARSAGPDVSCYIEFQLSMNSIIRRFPSRQQTPLQLSGTNTRQRDSQWWKFIPGPLFLEGVQQSFGDAVGDACPAWRHFAFYLARVREGVSPSYEALVDALFVSDGLLEDAGSSAFNVEKGLVPAVFGTFRSSAVNYCWSRCSTWWKMEVLKKKKIPFRG